MSDLITDTPEAKSWALASRIRHGADIYGKVVSGVMWSDARGPDGQLLVEADPDTLVNALAQARLPLLHNHDPGRPIGHVVDAARFRSPRGQEFVAVVLGYYAREAVQTFEMLGLGSLKGDAVRELPELPDGLWIEIATDPREVPSAWVDLLAADAPLPVVRTDLSHNAADPLHEIIHIGIAYAVLVWNPFVKSFATEAGKAVYSGAHAWLKVVFERLRDRRAPVLSIDSKQDGCHVAFLIRGTDVAVHYAAHAGLSGAAAEAASLITALNGRPSPVARLVYEFETKALRWHPSYAVLENGRIVTHAPELIALAADLPQGLSLGMRRKDMGEP